MLKIMIPNSVPNRLLSEMAAIQSGAVCSPDGAGNGLNVFIYCNGNSEQVRKRICDVLVISDQLALQREEDLVEWERRLPQWFCGACSRPQTIERSEIELRRFQSLNWEEQEEHSANRHWSLPEWQHWMKADNRFWYVRKLIVQIEDLVEGVLDSDETDPPVGAFHWLCKAAGATHIL